MKYPQFEIADFGGFKEPELETTIFHKAECTAPDSRVVTLGSLWAKRLVDAKDRGQPLDSHGKRRYGSFNERKDAAKATFASRLLGGPKSPLIMDHWRVMSDFHPGISQSQYSMLTPALVSLHDNGIPLVHYVPIVASEGEIKNIVGAEYGDIKTIAEFKGPFEAELEAYRTGKSPFAYAFEKHNGPRLPSPFGDRAEELTLRQAALVSLFLANYQVMADEKREELYANLGVDQIIPEYRQEAEQREKRDNKRELEFLTEAVSTIFELERRGIDINLEAVGPLFSMTEDGDLQNLQSWSDDNKSRQAYPLRPAMGHALMVEQEYFIHSLPDYSPLQNRLADDLNRFWRGARSGQAQPQPG